jgi:hypothetical protein
MFVKGCELYRVIDDDIKLISSFNNRIKHFRFDKGYNETRIIIYTEEGKLTYTTIDKDSNITHTSSYDSRMISKYESLWYTFLVIGVAVIVYPDTITKIMRDGNDSGKTINIDLSGIGIENPEGLTINDVIRSGSARYFGIALSDGRYFLIKHMLVINVCNDRERDFINAGITDIGDGAHLSYTGTMGYYDSNKYHDNVLKIVGGRYARLDFEGKVFRDDEILSFESLTHNMCYYSEGNTEKYLRLTIDNKLYSYHHGAGETLLLEDATGVILPVDSTYDFNLTKSNTTKSARS